RELGAAADHVQLALERVALEARRGADEELTDARRGGAGRLADVRRVDRHVAPGDDTLAFVLDRRREQPLELGPARLVVREEADGDPVGADRRQLRVGDAAEERIRGL